MSVSLRHFVVLHGKTFEANLVPTHELRAFGYFHVWVCVRRRTR